MNKQGKGKFGITEFAIVAVAILLIAGALGFIPGSMSGLGSGSDGEGTIVTVQGDSETVTAKIGFARDALTKTTKLSTLNYEIFLDNVDTESVSDGTSRTYAQGNKLQLLAGHDSGDYYAYMTPEIELKDQAITLSSAMELLLYKNYSTTTDLTVKIINEDDNDANGASNPQPLDADETEVVEISFTGVSNKALSPYGKNLMVYDINKTTIEDLSFGSPFEKTSMIPTQHSVGTVDDRAVAFLFPGIVDFDKTVVRDVAMELNTDDSSAPGDGEDIECTIYDYDWFQNSNTGDWEQGYEDNTGSDVGGPNQVFTMYYN